MPKNKATKPPYTITQFAELCKISRQRVWRLLKGNRLEYVRYGNQYLIYSEDYKSLKSWDLKKKKINLDCQKGNIKIVK